MHTHSVSAGCHGAGGYSGHTPATLGPPGRALRTEGLTASHTHAHTHTHTHTHTHKHAYKHRKRHTYAHTHKHTQSDVAMSH
jgi:hypothetical protein